MFDDIEVGAEFYFTEEDYLTSEELNGAPPRRRKRPRIRIKAVTEYTVKAECSPGPSTPQDNEDQDAKLRPRRHLDSSVNYYVPDSDDEMIAEDEGEEELKQELSAIVKKRKDESNLQKWIKHLTSIYKEEQKKVCSVACPDVPLSRQVQYSEKKKALQASVGPNMRLKVPKVRICVMSCL